MRDKTEINLEDQYEVQNFIEEINDEITEAYDLLDSIGSVADLERVEEARQKLADITYALT